MDLTDKIESAGHDVPYPQKGTKTSEFKFAHIPTMVVGLALVIGGMVKDQPEWVYMGMAAVGATSVAYPLSRGLSKRGGSAFLALCLALPMLSCVTTAPCPDPASIRPTIERMVDRDADYVADDPTMSPFLKQMLAKERAKLISLLDLWQEGQ